MTKCYCAELSDWMCFDHQNLLCRYKKLFLAMGGPVNTGNWVVSLLPPWKIVTFPQFTFAHSYLFYLSLKILILRIKQCYAKITKHTIKQMPTDWLGQSYVALLGSQEDLHHPNEGVPWHLWAKINPHNVQQDFRGWTNEGNRRDYKGVKKWQLSDVLWTPTAETSQPKLFFLQKHRSNKICFITIHKILMFAISHAACQTLHALVKTFKVHVIPYKV